MYLIWRLLLVFILLPTRLLRKAIIKGIWKYILNLSSFLSKLNKREYSAAVDAVHQLFDYYSNGNKTLLPYSSLFIAIVHFHFGHFEQAIRVCNFNLIMLC